MGIDASLFRSVLGRFATGVTIVTALDQQGQPHGMTVSAFSSLSLEPPLILVCIDNEATMSPLIATVDHFVVNVLSSTQEELSRRFADQLDDRFAGIGYRNASSGPPIVDDVLAWIECRVVARHPAGDHVIVIGEVENGEALEGEPLLYYRSGYARLAR
jgi:flavin reductase (DIM6/NTAB) family NADH-FMN oxidoreductase RutF